MKSTFFWIFFKFDQKWVGGGGGREGSNLRDISDRSLVTSYLCSVGSIYTKSIPRTSSHPLWEISNVYHPPKYSNIFIIRHTKFHCTLLIPLFSLSNNFFFLKNHYFFTTLFTRFSETSKFDSPTPSQQIFINFLMRPSPLLKIRRDHVHHSKNFKWKKIRITKKIKNKLFKYKQWVTNDRKNVITLFINFVVRTSSLQLKLTSHVLTVLPVLKNYKSLFIKDKRFFK